MTSAGPMTRTILAALALAATTHATSAQTADGTYAGTMICDAIPNLTRGPLSAPVSVTIAGSEATYRRRVQDQGGLASRQTESGSGTITPQGDVRLEARVDAGGGNTYRAIYTGKLVAGRGVLSGVQNWNLKQDPFTFARNCTLRF